APRGVQPSTGRLRPSPLALSGGGAVVGAADRPAAERISQIADTLRLSPFAIDRVRSDAAADRALLAARESRRADEPSGSGGRPDPRSESDVLVGNRHAPAI